MARGTSALATSWRLGLSVEGSADRACQLVVRVAGSENSPPTKGECFMSQFQRLIGLATLAGFAATLSIGCDSTEVKLQPAPPVAAPPPQPVPKDVKKGGGPGSSGNMQTNPGAST